MRAEIEVKNLKELQRQLSKLGPEFASQLRATNKTAAEPVATQAKLEVPVRTGRLKRSIGVKASRRSAAVKAGSATRVPYAGAIHWGWKKRGIKPQPFLKSAIRKTLPTVRKTYERALNSLTRKLR